MRNFVFTLVLSASLTACLSTHELDNVVRNKISNQLTPINLLDSSHWVLKTNSLQETGTPSLSQTTHSFFIPAIVYWGWENTMKCKVNNHYFVNMFAESLNKKTTERFWKEKLKDKKLEISLDSVPNQFVYSSKGMVLFLFSAYSYSFSKGLYPDDQQFKISYRLLENNVVLKQGSFWTKYTKPEYYKNQTEKHFVENFLDIQRDFFTTESANLIQQIGNDL